MRFIHIHPTLQTTVIVASFKCYCRRQTFIPFLLHITYTNILQNIYISA